MKKIIIPFVIMLISINVYFVQQSNQKVTESQTRLNDFFELSAFADGGEAAPEEYGCADNPTFIKNQSLQSANCWNGGTHKKCKDDPSVCCDPSKGTDCGGFIKNTIFEVNPSFFILSKI